MDHRLLAAFAVLASVFAVVGAASLLSDESDAAGSMYDGAELYVKGTTIDLSTASEDVSVYIPVTYGQGFLVQIPLVLPEGVDFPSGYSSSSSFSTYFRVDYYYSDGILTIFGDSYRSGSNAGYIGFSFGPYSERINLYVSFSSSGIVSPFTNHNINYQYSSIDHGFVENEDFTYEFYRSLDYDFFIPLQGNDYEDPLDFFTLSEDGNSISGTAPACAGFEPLYVFFFGFDDSFKGDILVFTVGYSSADLIPTDTSFELVVDEEFESFQVLEVVPYIDVDWSYKLPDGIGFGTSSSSSKLSEFWVWGTPTSVGTFDVTITATDKFTDLVFGSVTVQFVIIDKFTVVFHDDDGSELFSFEVVDGDLIPPLSVAPVKEGMVFAGWFTDPDLTVPFDPRSDYPASDLDLYPGFAEPVPEPEPEPPVSDGVVSNDPLDDSTDVPLGLLIILGLVVVVGLVAVAGGRRR